MSDAAIVPAHVGIILDGNRRWAKKQGLPTIQGHQKGAEAFKEVALGAFDRGVHYLSAFVFSTENWQRTEEEVGFLMNLLTEAVKKYLNEFHERGIRIVVLGRRDGIRSKVLEAIERTEKLTKGNKKGTLALCFNYGGQEEIVDAVRTLLRRQTDEKTVTSESIQDALYYPEVPALDLVIRTSGEMRTSGFMLYRAAYAELHFVDKFWPDFTLNDFETALSDYALRQRRFGA